MLRALFQRLFGSHSRTVLTPGQLYRRMSADFRSRRPRGHGACVMAMVASAGTRGSGPNWRIERLTSHCPVCDALSRRIAGRYAQRFDLREPLPPQDLSVVN